MSREIKFRAWDFNDKQMQQVTALYFELDRVREVETLEHKGVYIRNFADPEEITVMQSTGLKDKNGIEIYEGDILRSHHFYDTEGKELKLSHIVQWSEKYSGWYALNVDSMDEGDGSQQLWAYMRNAIEPHVIGNIHENPELMEITQ